MNPVHFVNLLNDADDEYHRLIWRAGHFTTGKRRKARLRARAHSVVTKAIIRKRSAYPFCWGGDVCIECRETYFGCNCHNGCIQLPF